ncbi:TonB-dependent receptor [Sphingomonas abietis]|uniref:TonB-dependent receptor n=1 Tax=Sphingomonas abietis TaxID=3012344 RepID=A0ABY7NNM7_9SPHN|nr:TonB-dependent receptor [Sphingomonas abietis]WBO22817.1 TonB-dependent receptor [Sphingomonas abietis]
MTSAAALLAGLAMPAWAQTAAPAAPAGANGPGEIVVTAQKRSERLQEVPLAVSVVKGDALSAQGKPNIQGAVALVPSLNVLQSGTTLNQSIFLRGVGTSSFSIAGEPSVSTVLDGVVYARSGEAFGDLIDIDRMEVLRGPQGTLFGKNASAGVINIVSQQPTARFGGSFESSYYSGNEFRERAVLNVPITPTLLTRFTGFYGSYDGNIHNVAPNVDHKVNGYKHYGGREQVTWEPSDKAKFAFIADYHHNNDDCCAEIIGTGALTSAGVPTSSAAFQVLPTPKGDKSRTVDQDLVTRTRETGYGFSLQGDFALGTQTVTTITAYRHWKNTEIRDGDWLPQAYIGFNQLHDFGPETSHTFSQEIRLASPVHQLLSYVVGAYYSNAWSERKFTRYDQVCTPASGVAPTTLTPCTSPLANASTYPTGTADFGSRFKNLALFGQGTLNLTDRFRFIGGARYTMDQLNVFAIRRTTLAGPGINSNFDQGVYDATVAGLSNPGSYSNGVPWQGKATSTNLSGKAALQYDVTRGTTAYVSYTRGYKGPAFNVFYNLTATGTNVIAPETSNAFEAGLKNTLFGGTLVLNIDAFYTKYHNFQANNPDLVAGVVTTRFTNAGTVSTRGAEADLVWRPLRDLAINGGVAYTDAHVDRFKVAPGAAATAIIPSGTPLIYAPKWKGSLSADYRWRTGGPIDVFLGAQGSYESKELSQFSPDPVVRAQTTIHGYALVNLSAGIGDTHDRYRLTFQVRNLTDESFAAAIQSGGPGGSYRYQISRDADRYWGVTGRVNF